MKFMQAASMPPCVPAYRQRQAAVPAVPVVCVHFVWHRAIDVESLWDEFICVLPHLQAGRQTDGQTDGQADGQAGRQAGRQASRQTDGQAGRL